jgi:cell wall-associated NlpC family hydrolase
MRRLFPLLGAVLVLALALAGTAGADTFRVARSHAGANGGPTATFSSGTNVVDFTPAKSGPMSFAALRGIWQAAGSTYGIPWQVLAAINKVETNFGQNLGPSSAGAVGWMQFMPSTWARWGVDANGDGVADPDNPTDAIFSAARYLAGCGGQFDIVRAVYCYNHATWYVNEVLGLAALYGDGGGAGTGLFSADSFAPSGASLQPQISKTRGEIATSKSQVAAARQRAEKLARGEQRLLHVAATARLLSDQLDARKQAVLLGARRNAVDTRMAQIRDRLRSATKRLGRLRGQASGSTGRLASASLYGGLGAGQSNGAVAIAAQYLGVPYTWGGASPMTGFDCSGLVQYVYAQLGIELPHNTVAQWTSPNAVPVPRNQLQPGDLVFFNGLDHVGIYIGDGNFIDAPHTGAFVRIDSLRGGWERANYDGARRVVGASFGDAFGATAFSPNGTSFTSNVVYFTR